MRKAYGCETCARSWASLDPKCVWESYERLKRVHEYHERDYELERFLAQCRACGAYRLVTITDEWARTRVTLGSVSDDDAEEYLAD
jgi:hypothetical protein